MAYADETHGVGLDLGFSLGTPAWPIRCLGDGEKGIGLPRIVARAIRQLALAGWCLQAQSAPESA